MPINDARQYHFSFSGTDAKPFVYFGGMEQEIVALPSLQTMSVSVHEAKGQARALGFRGIRGLSRGVRTIAGTMIFTIIEDHPLRPLIDLASNIPSDLLGGWSVDRDMVGTGTAINQLNFNNRLITLLPPFNLVIHYVSEVDLEFTGGPPSNSTTASAAAELVYGVEFITFGKPVSVHDMMMEVTASFIAYDYKSFSKNDLTVINPPSMGRDYLVHEDLMKFLVGPSSLPAIEQWRTSVEATYFDSGIDADTIDRATSPPGEWLSNLHSGRAPTDKNQALMRRGRTK